MVSQSGDGFDSLHSGPSSASGTPVKYTTLHSMSETACHSSMGIPVLSTGLTFSTTVGQVYSLEGPCYAGVSK